MIRRIVTKGCTDSLVRGFMPGVHCNVPCLGAYLAQLLRHLLRDLMLLVLSRIQVFHRLERGDFNRAAELHGFSGPSTWWQKSSSGLEP
jgi:hypothetical protein